MLSFRAVISYYLILFRSIAALQVAAIKNLFHFYSSPVALGQNYFVLVLISTNHNARNLYPEMDISWTGMQSHRQKWIWCITNPTPARRVTPPWTCWNVYMAKFDPGRESYPVWQTGLPALAGHPTHRGVLGILIDGDDRRIFWGLKFSIPGFFWVRKFGLGSLIWVGIFWGY